MIVLEKLLASASSKEKGIDTNIKDRKSMAEVIGKNIAQRSIEKVLRKWHLIKVNTNIMG